MSFQFNVNDTLERPSRVSFIKLSEESNESCQGIVIQHVFPQVTTIAEERTIFLAAPSVNVSSWKDSVVSSQRMLGLNTTTDSYLVNQRENVFLISMRILQRDDRNDI